MVKFAIMGLINIGKGLIYGHKSFKVFFNCSKRKKHNRSGKRVTLTEDGMLLRKRAEEILDLFEKTKAELSNSDKNITGEIYIGCGESEAVSFFAKAAKSLQKEHPLIHYHIYSGDAERVTERLDKGLIDFGLLIGDVDIEKYDYLKLFISDT